MGERVVIRDEPPLASEAPDARVQGVPLGYGRANTAGNVLRWLDTRLRMLGDAMKELFGIIVPALGGWRQIAFAFGLAFILGGVGDALAVSHNGDAPAMMFVGGLLVGLTLRLPWLKGDRS